MNLCESKPQSINLFSITQESNMVLQFDPCPLLDIGTLSSNGDSLLQSFQKSLIFVASQGNNRTNFNRIRANGIPDSQQNEENTSKSELDSSSASRFQPYDHQRASPVTDTTSLNSSQASEIEDAESGVFAYIC